MHWRRKIWIGLFAVVWLPLLRWVLAPESREHDAEGLAQTQLRRWRPEQPEAGAVAPMRAINPEWDFMSRTFTVLGLANRALEMEAGQERRRTLAVIDHIIDGTLSAERRHGVEHFTLGYVRDGRFLNPAGRSLFIDGEVLMMMAARQLVEPEPAFEPEMRRRARWISEHMQAGPVLSGESYPDECWTFCNTTALAALRLYDATRLPRAGVPAETSAAYHSRDADVLGEVGAAHPSNESAASGETRVARHSNESGASGKAGHAELARRWVQLARERLVEPESGLLVSSYHYDGRWRDGPEGSSLWMSAHNLQLIDEAFAREQYQAARRQLGFSILGFGLAREWPAGQGGHMDVDSGPIVPLLDASAGSSGLAILGAASFGDETYLLELRRSLQLAGFPIRDRQELRFAAAGPMGDAVAFYALWQGPLWSLAKQRLEQS